MAKATSNVEKPIRRGVIRPGEAYHRDEAIRRLGVSRRQWQQLRRNGLPVFGFKKSQWVFGDDLLSFLRLRQLPAPIKRPRGTSKPPAKNKTRGK